MSGCSYIDAVTYNCVMVVYRFTSKSSVECVVSKLCLYNSRNLYSLMYDGRIKDGFGEVVSPYMRLNGAISHTIQL